MTVKYEFKTEPFDHQREALKRSWDKESFAWLMEMGTGKTKVCIDNLGILWRMGLVRSALILAPKGVYANWTRREIPIHMPDSVLDEVVMVEWQAGMPKATKAALDEALAWPGPRILVMNTEALSRPGAARKIAAEFARDGFVAVDESTQIKGYNSGRTKAVTEIMDLAKYKRIMTGSPTPNGPLDLFGQFRALDWKILGQRNYFAWRSRYAVVQKKEMRGRMVPVVVGHRNLEELHERISKHSYRVTKDECLTLPPKVYTMRSVELTDEQKRMYRELKEYAFAEIGDEFISVSTVLAQILRLHQVCCGYTVTEDGEEIDIESNRLSEMVSVIEENVNEGRPPATIIWANYRRSIRDVTKVLREKFPDETVVEYWGDTSNVDREIAIEKFQSGEAKFFVGNPQTAGRGITLTEAEMMIYYANSWDLEMRLQSEDRAHRSGLKHTVTYVDLVAEGTVDEKIISALRKKINLSAVITGDDYREWLI